MLGSGNLHQWPEGYPSREMVLMDIRNAYGKVIMDGCDVVGYFACIPSPDLTYSYIEGGRWLDEDTPYYVIHRIAKRKDARGVFAAMLHYVETLTDNIRIDTHKDNAIMQHLLCTFGFHYCGVIYLSNGAPRLAYQRLAPAPERAR